MTTELMHAETATRGDAPGQAYVPEGTLLVFDQRSTS
jgi:hypothetical protein